MKRKMRLVTLGAVLLLMCASDAITVYRGSYYEVMP